VQFLLLMPISLPNLQLALQPYFKAADKTNLSTAETVLITGASGGVATDVLSSGAKSQGFTTIGTSRSEVKGTYALSMGFDKILVANPTTLKRSGDAELADGKRVQLAFDHLGGECFPACMRSLSAFRLCDFSYNISSGKPTEDVFSVLRELLGKSLGIRCLSMHSFDEDRIDRRQLMQEAPQFNGTQSDKSPHLYPRFKLH
jgi:NADPH2:quinone reductase